MFCLYLFGVKHCFHFYGDKNGYSCLFCKGVCNIYMNECGIGTVELENDLYNLKLKDIPLNVHSKADPYEIWMGKPPRYSYLRIWEPCLCEAGKWEINWIVDPFYAALWDIQ